MFGGKPACQNMLKEDAHCWVNFLTKKLLKQKKREEVLQKHHLCIHDVSNIQQCKQVIKNEKFNIFP